MPPSTLKTDGFVYFLKISYSFAIAVYSTWLWFSPVNPNILLKWTIRLNEIYSEHECFVEYQFTLFAYGDMLFYLTCVIPPAPKWSYVLSNEITNVCSYFLNDLNFSFETNWVWAFGSVLDYQYTVQASLKL